MIDHRVHDAVQQRHRTFPQDVRVLSAHVAHPGDAARLAVVDGDQVVGTKEEVHVPGAEFVLARVEVDAVEDDVQVAVVRLHLRVVDVAERVLDGEGVEVEGVREDGLSRLGRWSHQVHPDVLARVDRKSTRLNSSH